MTITPRFEANIGADISKFMQKANEVDAKIREMATGVIVDITAQIQDFMSDANRVQDTINDIDRTVDVTVNGNITDLERAVTEANAQIAALNDSATVNINGNNTNFNNAASDVNRATRNLRRRVTEARIGADIGEFENRMVRVTRALTEADGTVTPRIQLDIDEFQREILEVEDRMREVARSTADPEVEADIAGFMAQMALVQAQLNSVAQIHDIDIRADTGSAHARLSALWLQIRSLTAKDFVIKIEARWNKFTNTMGSIANFSRSMAEIGGSMGRNSMIAMSPTLVPILGSVVHLIGNLAPMIGVMAGSTFALGSAFITAGLGAVAFGAAAIPTIKALFDETNNLTQAQQAAKNEYTAFQTVWQSIVKELEKPVLSAFGEAMKFAARAVEMARPLFSGAAEAVNNLMVALNQSLDGAPMKAFFEYLGNEGGPLLETIGKSIGFLMQGFFNMMTAFAPLTEATANGFMRMSEGFAEWAAALSESKKFQSFVDYVNENMPKIRAIFGDAFKGIINLFAGFGESSSDMMTSLQESMAKFKEWSAALAESKGFQTFMDYVRTNSPVVVAFLGELISFIKNLVVAMAPWGEKMLAMAKATFEFMNGLMEAHPWIGKVMAAFVVFSGTFLALLPILVGVNALFGGVITWLVKLGATALIQGAKMAAAWVIGLGPIAWVTVAVIAIALLIYKYWDEISAWTKKSWTAVSSAVTTVVAFIMSWIEQKFPAIYAVIQSAMKMIKEVISIYWEFSKATFQNVLSFLKSLVKGDFQGMKDTISNQMKLAEETIAKIWGSVKLFLSETLGILLDKFGVMFGKIVLKIREKMGEAVETVGEFIGKMPGKVLSFVGAMVTAGADLVGGVISGIKSKIAEGLGVIGGLASSLISRFKKDTDTHSPSRAFENIAKWFPPGIVRGIESTSGQAYDAVTTLANGMTSAFNPQMELADMRASAHLDTSVSRADMGVVRHAFAAEVGEIELEQEDLVLMVDGRELGKVVARSVQEENDNYADLVAIERGGL